VKGRFFVLDGPDGGGKTTQVAALRDYLTERGEQVKTLREPGATSAGEAIRDLLLDPQTDLIPVAEMLLYQAARAQMVDALLRPTLESGVTVLLDRYWYSTAAYQGHGLGLDIESVREVSRTATGGLEPDHLFVLDVEPEVGLSRIQGEHDRIEGRPLEYHRRVREGFLAEARRLGDKATILDASRPAAEVSAIIRQVVDDL
jgi:dTMP kinase